MSIHSVLISDSNDIFRLGLSSVFKEMQNIQSVCSARNEEEIISLLLTMRFDMLCLDIDMIGSDPLTLIDDIRKQGNLVKIILFSSILNKNFIRDLLKAGANSFLSKSASPLEIQQLTSEIAKNNLYLLPSSQTLLLESFLKHRKIGSKSDALCRELLFLISHELTINEITECLQLSKKVIEYHRSNLLKNIGAKNMAGLAIYAFQTNIYCDKILHHKFERWINSEKVGVVSLL